MRALNAISNLFASHAPSPVANPHHRPSVVSTADTLVGSCFDNGPPKDDGAPREPAESRTWPAEWKAYACLFGGFLLMFNSWGIVNAYGTFASYYTEQLMPEQGVLRMNFIGSTQSFFILLLSAPVGRLLDAGHIRPLLLTGTLLLSTGYFTLSVANGSGDGAVGDYGLTWLTQGLLSSLGMACFFVSSSQVVATWFVKRKGLAIGIVASGASIAGLVYPYMWRTLVEDGGFDTATRYLAIVITLTAALSVFLARPNPEHIIRKPETWTDYKVFWDGKAFANSSFTCLVISISFLFFGFYAVFFNLEEWAVRRGFGFRQGGRSSPGGPQQGQMHTYWLLAIMNASSTVGRIGSAYLCDHLGALNVHCAVTAAASILTLVLWSLASNLDQALAYVTVFGVFSGAVIGLPPASVAYTLGPSPREQAKLGQWTGMMYSCAAVPALVGPVIAGYLITRYDQNYLTVQLWAGACLLASAAFMAAGVVCRQRRKRADDMKSDSESDRGPSAHSRP